MKQPDFPDIGDKRDVADYRLRIAKEDLDAAYVLLEAESYRGANNRAYYAIFHAVSAVLALEGIASKEDTVQQVETADKLIQLLSDFCQNKNKESEQNTERKVWEKLAKYIDLFLGYEYNDRECWTKACTEPFDRNPESGER